MTVKSFLKTHGLKLVKLHGNVPTMYGAIKQYGFDSLRVLIMHEKTGKNVYIMTEGCGEWRKYFDKEAAVIEDFIKSTNKYDSIKFAKGL